MRDRFAWFALALGLASCSGSGTTSGSGGAGTSVTSAMTATQFEIKGAEGSGCDGHPNTVTHARLGAELTAFIHTNLGW